jgi:DUF1365 family protein
VEVVLTEMFEYRRLSASRLTLFSQEKINFGYFTFRAQRKDLLLSISSETISFYKLVGLSTGLGRITTLSSLRMGN